MDATRSARPSCPACSTSCPASRTVLIKLAGPRYQAPTRQRLGKLQVRAEARRSATPTDGRADVEIEVVYDGADLDEVARLTGLTPDQVVAAHTGTLWRVGFGGFAPGFAYLIGGDARLEVPRRAEPRTKVPAGSVGLAGEFSGVYPRESPGGWQLIGRTADSGAVGRRPRPARPADAGHVGPVPGGDSHDHDAGDPAHRAAGADRGSRPARHGAHGGHAAPARPTAGRTRWPTGWSPTPATAPPSRSRSAGSPRGCAAATSRSR